MQLLEINIEYRVIFGISGMVVLFASFLIVFIISQRKKLQYHKKLHVLHEQQQQILTQQNLLLEKRVEERTLDLVIQKNELQKSLRELNIAQLQLIQREKMASLGELTAGIAHEIQNPLNFVNNFSEISIELMDELRNELKNSGKEEAIAIINNITENIERINHHGKRADGIVKGMLEHSKGISGQKELTDINKLADESLRISYSSTRAKDTSFTASFETFLDDSVGEIFLVPQDIARVFLNLFNNAFYSVNEKRKLSDENFNPTVSVTTKRENNKIVIVIRDNGTGIPQKIVHKIFQPFFTTKPTGQGTGLGLSLSYSIIKAHGGEIKVESIPGESTELIIKLPIQA